MSKNLPPPPVKRGGGLGRGLAALIPDDVVQAASAPRGAQIVSVPLDAIQRNPEQPRTRFDGELLEELASSIRNHGVLSPLLVRPIRSGGYALIAGERRLRAAALAGLSEVPVLVRSDADSAQVQLELALVENLQRDDLDPVEAARGYSRLVDDFGLTQEDVARKVGKDRATVANALRLLRLPEHVLQLVQDGKLSAGHARALISVEDTAALREIVARVLAEDLSVRATEKLVALRAAPRSKARKSEPDRALRHLTERLSRRFSTAVEIKPKARGKGGRISIDYYSPEDLERILALLQD